MKNTLTYDILIPAYNAGDTISKLLIEINSLGEKPQKITIINDGSTDNTVKKCENFEVVLINHKHNLGKGDALKTGFESFLYQSEAEYLLCMDADLQHPVGSIPDFLQRVRESKSRFVIGARNRTVKSMPVHRILSNAMTSFIISTLTGQKIEDSQCGFRLIHRKVLEVLDLKEDGYQLESEMLLKASQQGVKIDFTSIPTIYNNEKSHMRNFSDTLKFVQLILKHLIGKLFISSRAELQRLPRQKKKDKRKMNTYSN